LRYSFLFSSVAIVCLSASSAIGGPIPVSATASFTGFNNTWSFSYTVGDVGVYLQQITIDLSPTNARFDTAAGGYGSLGFQDVGGFGGTDASTGLNTVSAAGSGLDGGSILTFTFADFNVGEFFTFSADLDHPNPNLLTLSICTGTPLQRLACQAANVLKTTTNNAGLLAADTVLSAQVADALVTFDFGGPGLQTVSVTSPLQAATLRGLITGLLNGDLNAAASTASPADLIPAPEPSTAALLLAGLGACAAVAGRRVRQ
jgi:hypothetical protein